MRFTHNAASRIITAPHNPHGPANASEAATLKKIKKMVDKLYCIAGVGESGRSSRVRACTHGI